MKPRHKHEARPGSNPGANRPAPDCFFGVEGDDIFQGGGWSKIKGNLDRFAAERMGNFIALRAYLVSADGAAVDYSRCKTFAEIKAAFLKSVPKPTAGIRKQLREQPWRLILPSKKVIITPDHPAMRAFAYLAEKEIYSISLYSAFDRPAAEKLQRGMNGYFLFPIGGEMAGGLSGVKPEDEENFETIDRACVRHLRRFTARHRAMGFKDIGHVDPPLFHARGLRAGINIPVSESMTAFLQLQMASIRGDARGLGDGRFGSWLAIGYFGGANVDPLKPLRLRVGLLSSFIAGAKYIISETGHFGTFEYGNRFTAPNLVADNLRREISRVYSFVRERKREGGPVAEVAFVKGRLDGWSGCMGREVFMRTEKGGMWLHSSAERGWDMLSTILQGYRRCDDYPLQDAETSWFCGTPYGQFDIVPAEARPGALARYRVLIFPGWNTMNAELYRKLKTYVSGGGILFMAAPQLSTDVTRPVHVCSSPDMKLFNNGRYEDLFGVRIAGMGDYFERINFVQFKKDFYGIPRGKRYEMHVALHPALGRPAGAEVIAMTHQGHPFMTRKKVGKGYACLLLTWDYPGLNAYRALMRACIEALIKKAQPRYRVEGSTQVEMAVYRKGALETIYLLNCDLERSTNITVEAGAHRVPVSVPPASIRTLYACGNTAVLFDSEETLAEGAALNGNAAVFDLRGRAPVEGWVFLAGGRELSGLALGDERVDQTCFGFRKARFAFTGRVGALTIRFK